MALDSAIGAGLDEETQKVEAVRTIARNRCIVFTTALALIVGSLVVSPRAALSQTVGDCLTSTASGNWRLAAEICERVITDLLGEMMPPSGCNLWPRGCPTPDWVTVAESELAYSEVTEAEALIETHYGHLKLAEYWLGQALHDSEDLAHYPRNGPSAIIYSMVPNAKVLAARQSAELATLEKRIGSLSPLPKPHALPKATSKPSARSVPYGRPVVAATAAVRSAQPSVSSQIPLVELPAGTPVSLIGDGSVSSSGARSGTLVTIYAAQDLKVNDWTAIARCAVGQARVVSAQPASAVENGLLVILPYWIESTDGEHISLNGEPFTVEGAVRSTFFGFKSGDVTLDNAHPLVSHTSQDVYLQRSTGSITDAAPSPGNSTCRRSPSAQSQGAQPPRSPAPLAMQTANIRLLAPNRTALELEVADTPQKREAGLQGRQNVPSQHGMLFVFPDDEQATLWMKGVPYPLDFIFVSGDGHITSVQTIQGVDAVTPDYQIPRFSGYGRYVIAVPAGEASADGFQVGTTLTGLPGSPSGQL